MSQNLYIIECQGYFKIGVASDIASRLAQLSTGNPFPLTVQCVYKFENADPVERALHQRYKDNRVRGEWFELSYEDQQNIHRVCLALGGSAFEYDSNVTEDELEDAELSYDLPDGGKWDFRAMFADGWRMETTSSRGKNGVYWAWRRTGVSGRPYIYGGKISDLPYPMEEMRNMFLGEQ